MVAAGLALYLAWIRNLTPVPAPLRLPMWAVAALTLIAECSVIRFAAFRRDARGYSLGELALVTGLYLADPLGLLAGRLLGLGVIDVIQQRQHSLAKVAFNLAKTLLETSVAVVVFHALLRFGQPLGPAGWVAAFATTIVADLLSKLLIDLAIKLSGAPRPDQRWHEDLGIGVTVAFGTTSIALIGVTLLWVYPQAAWLLFVPMVILFAVYRGYARQRPRYDSLTFLYETARTLQAPGQSEDLLVRLLSQARDAFQAELGIVILLPTAPGESATELRIGPGDHRVVQALAPGTALGGWEAMLAGRRATLVTPSEADPAVRDHLAGRGITDAMVAALHREHGTIGVVVVANRLGSAVFHEQELRALETIASHASAALENARLVKHLGHLALHDPLTGLPNRSVLHSRLARALARMERDKAGVAVLFVDLDGFKAVNDRLGHGAGDQLLTTVAQRFRRIIKASDLLVRFAGDEFVVLCENVEDQHVPMRVADRIRTVLAEPMQLDEGTARVGASIGVALAHPGEEPEPLVRRADLAMYEAKRRGKGHCVLSPGPVAAQTDAREH
jgi:diguanylate cyclase (GGDEF)-like protein